MFASIFQYFVLAVTLFLVGAAGWAYYRSLRQPSEAAAQGGDVSFAPFSSAPRRGLVQILILAAASRFVLYALAYLSARLVLNPDGGFWDSFASLWQRSDAPHYLAIVENGYVSTGEDQVFLVFLPFYPLVVKLFSAVFGSALYSGLVVSLLSFFAACVLVYEVALLLGQDEETAFLAAKYMIFFPASFFVNGTFSEGLFLLLSCLFFHFLLRKKWLAAACFGFFAAFTRYYGVLLAVPYFVEWTQDFAAARRFDPARGQPGPETVRPGGSPPQSRREARREARRKTAAKPTVGLAAKPAVSAAAKAVAPSAARASAPSAANQPVKPSASAIVKTAAPILLIPAGTGLFLVVNKVVSGSFFQFLTYQREHWNQSFRLFPENMRSLAANVLAFDPQTSASMFLPQLICIILFLGLMVFGILARFRLSMLVYLGVYFLLTISASWMLSFPRYLFGAAPVFCLMGALGRRGRLADALQTLVCLSGLMYLTFAYVCGYHVY
ncbi:MAG: hypothetical protein LBU58_02535 [Clostridiales bacterium]|nr:hypothetical protein [Clostridiales bacterium]